MTTRLAPIALFAYNRRDHLEQAVLSLRQNKEAADSDLYVFSDSAKQESDISAVIAVRAFLSDVTGFRSVTLIKREQNLGLAKSIISGVTELVEKHGCVIVLEDDLILSPYFLEYMNTALTLYQDVEAVASIHGYNLPLNTTLPETFFLKGTDCWGWATWKRAWDEFEDDGTKLLNSLKAKNLCFSFDLDGTVHNIKMLENQIMGKNNSWAIRWHASAFLNDKLTLFPAKSLVKNIGCDNSGTHCEVNDDFYTEVYQKPIKLKPIAIVECIEAREAMKSFYCSVKPTIIQRIIRKIKRFISI